MRLWSIPEFGISLEYLVIMWLRTGVTSDRSNGKVERLVFLKSIFKVVDCLFVDKIRRVFAGMDLDRTVYGNH